ncbi:hypothetical protein QJS10_CPA03g00858 [Acorus calamus]|uniref:DUF1639 family protein n=1 Tax=Acorus calamus TaxID=4465 RepID=A0AAV9FAD1_ACOCL|nr:hypothetical protein QJS10_CPA03g00858 [Acorus calamus]
MPPPPCSASYSRGENLRPSMPRWPPAPQLGRAMEDRSSRGGGGVHNKRSSPPTPPAQTKVAAACSIAGEKMMVNGSILSDREVGASASAHPAAPGKVNMDLFEWPRIYISLSRKEKEDDFLVMKGTKLPQRPKKRAKNVDKNLQYCFPGMWLSDLTRSRYEVREKKCVKKQKRRRGLKGLESMESDSD